MSTIFTFLANLKLSLQQYLYLSVGLVIGGLVIALRLQGSKLHAAQVAVLQSHYRATMDQQDAKVEAAKTRLYQAEKAFEASK
jgi:hypothetical protein